MSLGLPRKTWCSSLGVLLAAACLAPAQDTLLPRGSAWKYDNSNTDLGTAWHLPDYDDILWSGPVRGPLGSNLNNGIQWCASVIDIGPTDARTPVVYFRTGFTVTSASNYPALLLRLNRDPSAVVYLNGTLLTNVNVPTPVTFDYTGGTPLTTANATNYFQYTVPGTALLEGANVLAVEVHQVSATNSDLQFDLEVVGATDNTPPTLVEISPPGATVLDLSHINVVFNKSVVGVVAARLTLGNVAAKSVTTNEPNDYTFQFAQPSAGTVRANWSSPQQITDTTILSNRFAATNWSYILDTNRFSRVVISEFMANNATGIVDDFTNHSPWIELFNMGSNQVTLDGWYLTDDPARLTKWRFPFGIPSIQPDSHLLVWASGMNQTNANAPLHTNFKLSDAAGGYLALVDPSTNVISAFVSYPTQRVDVSYGRDIVDPSYVGYYVSPTPAAQNTTTGPGFLPDPVLSLDTGIYTNSTLTLTMSAPLGTIRYTYDGSVPTTNSPAYSTPITFGTNMILKARVFPPGGTNVFPSEVVGRNFLFLDNSDGNFNSNLPLLIISTQGRQLPQSVPPGGLRLEGTLAIIDTAGGRSSVRYPAEFQGFAGLEVYGQTSAGFPKIPVRIETHNAWGQALNVPLLGMPADNDWKLRNPYDDKSYMNDFLGYELFEKMGNYSCRRRFVEGFLATSGGRLSYPRDYHGIWVLMETIKVGKDRVAITPMTPYDTNQTAISGGWMFKKDKDSTGDINFSTSGGPGFGGQTLKIHQPGVNTFRPYPLAGNYTVNGTKQLNWLTAYLNQMEKALYATNWLATNVVGTTNHYSHYLDPDSFVDLHWVVEFTKQIDGYRLSDYFHKDRLGRVTAGPVWDWNLAFGNANYLQGGWTNGWYYEECGDTDHIWLRRLITGTSSPTTSTGDPEFTQKIADRWSVLRTNVLNGPNVLHRIDEISTLLSEAQVRDQAKYQTMGVYLWPNPDYTSSNGSDGHEDVDYIHPKNYLGNDTNSLIFQMKRYMWGRWLWIDSQFTLSPTISATDGPVTNGFKVTITPPPGAGLYYTLDGTDPRLAGGGLSPTALSNAGPVTLTVNSSVGIVARARKAGAWKATWSGPAAASLFTSLPPLRITEVMYDPAPPPAGSAYAASDFAFVEIKNIGPTALNLKGCGLGGDVQFRCNGGVLAAGQSAVVVANVAAFQSRYGTSLLVLGAFTGSLLSNADPPHRRPDQALGHLVLYGPLHETILDFYYDNYWQPATEGFGFSLVATDENAWTSGWGSAANWRASSAPGGSPGQNDPAPPARPGILVNEVLSNESGSADDAIELYNPTADAVDIGGWFLTGTFKNPRAYVIPAPTVLPAGGYKVFHATTSFGANGANSFGLSSAGDKVYLFSGNGVDLTGYAHGFVFGGSAKDVSFGRYVTSTGAEDFVAQVTPTLGSANTGPVVGPIVISEINFHPPDASLNGVGFADLADQYIELQNISGNMVFLYDTARPTNTWQLADAVSYQFPTGMSLPPTLFLLVVGFDPMADPIATAGFRARNLVPDAVPLLGPWQPGLDTTTARIELYRPGTPLGPGSSTPGLVPSILVDQVEYANAAPWPSEADGFGLTLQRLIPFAYGNDPTNWVAAWPSPGASYVGGGTPPTITSQPGDVLLPTGTNFLFSASATGIEPLHYQWRFNGLNLPGATNTSLLITNLQLSQGGIYSVYVINNGGLALGSNFNLAARIGLAITAQPTNRLVQTGQSNTITLTAVGTGILRYQWRFNGSSLTNATNASLVLTNIQVANQGTYDCVLRDDFDVLTSKPIPLTIVYKPVFTVHPVSQTGVAGKTASFSVAVSGTTPMSFRWRKGNLSIATNIARILNAPGYSVLTLTNLQASDASPYNVVITNIAGLALGGPSAGSSSNAVLTVLADTDHDGLPDDWEIAHGFNPNDPTDGARDDDGDGMSNAAEYIAGTDYLDPTSYLKTGITSTGGSVQFNAVSNRTYTVQYSDGLNPPQWKKLADVLAQSLTRIETVPDPGSRTNRYYRLVIPIQP